MFFWRHGVDWPSRIAIVHGRRLEGDEWGWWWSRRSRTRWWIGRHRRRKHRRRIRFWIHRIRRHSTVVRISVRIGAVTIHRHYNWIYQIEIEHFLSYYINCMRFRFDLGDTKTRSHMLCCRLTPCTEATQRRRAASGRHCSEASRLEASRPPRRSSRRRTSRHFTAGDSWNVARRNSIKSVTLLYTVLQCTLGLACS